MKEFFKRYPLFAYFTLVYSIAWGGILVINFYNGFQLFHGENVLSKGISGQLMLVWLIMLVAPGHCRLIPYTNGGWQRKD